MAARRREGRVLVEGAGSGSCVSTTPTLREEGGRGVSPIRKNLDRPSGSDQRAEPVCVCASGRAGRVWVLSASRGALGFERAAVAGPPRARRPAMDLKLPGGDSPSTRPPRQAPGGGDDTPGRPMVGLKEPPSDLIPAKTFSGKLFGRKKVRVTVDVLGICVVEDSKKANVVETYALSKVSDCSMGKGKGKNSLHVSLTDEQDVVFESKEAQMIVMAVQGAKMARLAFLESQKLSAKEQAVVETCFARVPALQACTAAQRSKLAKYTTIQWYEGGEQIVAQGARPDGLYILSSGYAVADKDGQAAGLRYGPGDFFGELAMVKDAPRQPAAAVFAERGARTSCFRLVAEEYETVVGVRAEALLAQQRTHGDSTDEQAGLGSAPHNLSGDEGGTVDSPLIAHTFEDQGPLGIVWGMAQSADKTIETAVLKGTKAGSPAGKVAESVGLVPGATLVAVNGSRCAGLSYTDQIQLIRDATRPLAMVFGPKGKSVARYVTIRFTSRFCWHSRLPDNSWPFGFSQGRN